MKKLFLLLMGVVGLSLMNCQSSNPEHIAEEKLKDEVMVIHDEVMPKMSEINRLKKKLKKLADSNVAGDDSAKKTIEDAIQYLEDADEGMMSWMNQFKQPSSQRKEKTHDEIMTYLTGEKAKIEVVKNDMLGSISKAKELLESYSKAQ